MIPGWKMNKFFTILFQTHRNPVNGSTAYSLYFAPNHNTEHEARQVASTIFLVLIVTITTVIRKPAKLHTIIWQQGKIKIKCCDVITLLLLVHTTYTHR